MHPCTAAELGYWLNVWRDKVTLASIVTYSYELAHHIHEQYSQEYTTSSSPISNEVRLLSCRRWVGQGYPCPTVSTREASRRQTRSLWQFESSASRKIRKPITVQLPDYLTFTIIVRRKNAWEKNAETDFECGRGKAVWNKIEQRIEGSNHKKKY